MAQEVSLVPLATLKKRDEILRKDLNCYKHWGLWGMGKKGGRLEIPVLESTR